jgi:hypothetical protein
MGTRRSKLAVFALIAATAVGAACWYIYRARQVAMVRDAVQMTAYTVRDLLARNGTATDPELHDAIVRLEKAGVIHLWYDSSGRIVDAWGTPLALEFSRTERDAPVVCKSAGPDRVMGTGDDISFVARVR